jgi:hypothetical protein
MKALRGFRGVISIKIHTMTNTFEHLATLHAIATEEMPNSENVQAIEEKAKASGYSIDQLRNRSIELENV